MHKINGERKKREENNEAIIKTKGARRRMGKKMIRNSPYPL
jgi:hypothetical protein